MWVLGGPHITRASARPQTTPVTPDPGRRAYPHAPRVPHALLTPIYILTIARRGTALRTTATSRDEPHTATSASARTHRSRPGLAAYPYAADNAHSTP